jgi:ABC-2 type transport system ATP-binding protein
MDRAIAIETSQLAKSYGDIRAIQDISFQVSSGEVFGLLGPNGAGKTTTLRILITVLPPSSGRATVLGYDVVRDADRVRQLIGYVPQERAVDRFLTGREHLQLLGALYHLSAEQISRRIGEVLALVDLEHKADQPVRTFSGGMKRKLDLACGLLANPQVLFLDEPTLGLDVKSRLRIWDYIRQLKQHGITVVMTTNYLEEADQLCDRVAIIDGGRIRALGSPTELKVGLGGDIVAVTVEPAARGRLESLAASVSALPAIRAVTSRADGLDIRVDSPEKALPSVLDAANRLGCRLEFIEYHRPRLEDVFVTYTGHAIREDFPQSDE